MVCDAIAGWFWWLTPDCERQVQLRARREAEEQRFANKWATALAVEKAERQARDVTVVKVGFTRLTIKSGADRTAEVYPRDVQPA